MSPDIKQFPVKSVQRRLLLPLACILLLLVGGGSASLLVNQQLNMKQSSQKLLEDVSRSFEISLKQNAKILTALEDSLLQDTHLHNALQIKDRNQLLDLFESTFHKFLKEYSVTHFYFHNPDKVNLLRVHKPEKYGDLINRFTLREAETSGKTAWGIELGSLGTFTLRVVQPVYSGDTLIGYLELGQEIEEELQLLEQGFNVELAMTINKNALDQLLWETGMEMLGRESNWNRYQELVLTYYTQSNFPSELDRFIQGDKESRRNSLEREVQFDDKSWQLIAHPLKDASGSEVGDLFILHDISLIKTKFTQIVATTVTLALLLLGLILTFYYRILRRTDQVISNQQKYLRKSKAKFQGLVESSSGWTWEVNTEGVYTYASPQVEIMLGYKPEEVVGKTPFDMMLPEEADRVAEIFKDFLEAAKPIVQLENVILHKDGQRLVFETYGVPILDDVGKVTGCLGMARDITASKQIGDRLREKERFQEKLLNDMLTFFAVLDPNGDVIFVNNTSLKVGGLELEDVIGKKFFDAPWWTHSDEVRNLVISDIEQCSSGESLVHDIQIHIADGSLLWIEYSMHPIFDEHGVVQYLVPEGRDITERKQAEEALLESEAQLRTLIETLPDLVWLKDPDGVYLACNTKFECLFGAKETEIVGKTDYDFVDKELADFFREKDKAAIAVRKASLNEEEVSYANDGHTERLETIKTPMFDRDGKLIGVLGVGRDITDRKMVETALRKSKEEWEKTFNAMSDIVTIQDKEMRIVRANKAAHDFFEVDYGGLVGKYCYEVFRGITEPCPWCPELKTLETIRCHSEIIDHEKLGKIFHVSSSPIVDENNEIEFLVHIAKDITKQKQLEEELFQSHKMEAIGTLAGGIAHDFNNVLSAIIGFSKLAKQDLPEGSSAVNDIDEIIKASGRAADLVQQILTFSRKSEHDLQSLHPHLIVKEVLRMLRSSLPSSVIIQEDINKRCGKILADPTNIHQIIMNLCTNALHAMEKETGTLTVRLLSREIAAEEIVHEADVSAGPFVVLSVSDTGKGMDESTKERIFEPYFTTKETGKGTGMGLAVIHGIIQDYKGFVRVDSTLGKGSTFSVFIPALQEETSRPEGSALKESESKTTLLTGNERILVVDDEPLLVKINEKQLERCGYTVTGTTDSRAALEKIRAQPEQFDLLITDQTMPGLSGVELAREVQRIKPALPIILCTGHSDVVSKEDALAMGIKKYVSKPIYRDELFLAIREVLDEK